MDEWSDEDDTDDKYIMKVGQQKVIVYGEEIPSDLIIDQPDLIDPVTRAHDHKRSFYSGNVHAKHPMKQYVDLKAPLALIQDPHADPIRFNLPLVLPIPKIPSHTYNTVDEDVVSYVWYECIQHGCDESELVKVRWLLSIGKAVAKHLGYALPFDKLSCIQGLEKDDYLEFIDLMADLVSIIANSPLYKFKEVDKPFICCSFPACIHRQDPSIPCPNSSGAIAVASRPPLQRTNTNKSLPADISDEHNDLFSMNELFRINVVYHRVMQEQNGILRIRHVFDICRELGIAYDKHQLPRHVAVNCTEFLVKSQEECRDLIDTIRVREKVVFDPTADLFKFVIPKWLKEEFKGSEILLYEHHFMLIDVDGGGSIDAEELQQLLLGFGTKVPLDEAQMILDEYDIDGGGTIDFVEFMILIYRIQRGTVEMENNELAQALMEAKSQLTIFEEILEVKKTPPEFCRVVHFGNTPVEATFSVEGPPDTIYAGAKIVVQLVFHDGYPYRQPDIKLLNRMFHVNVISQLDGAGRFLNIKELWSSDWTICKLLAHFIDILRHPHIHLLPANLKEIYEAWSEKLYLELLPRVPEYKKEVERRKQIAHDHKRISSAGARAESKLDQNTDSNRVSEAKKPSSADCKRAEEKQSKESAGTATLDSSRQLDAKPAEAKCGDDVKEEAVSKAIEVLEPIIPGKYLPLLSIEMLSTEQTKKKISKLSRIEQMHLTVLFTHLTDSRKYKMAVVDYVQKYSYVEVKDDAESPVQDV